MPVLSRSSSPLNGSGTQIPHRPDNSKTSLALLADEEAEYHRIEKTAGSYAEIRKRLDGLQQKKAESVRLTGELGFVTREIADLAARAEKQRALIKGLEADAIKKEELVAKVRTGLGAAQEIAEDRLETAVSFRLAEINKQTGVLATRQTHYQEEQEKILADQKTIRHAGPDGTCPLCRQKLGSHFGSLDAEFTQKLQELTDKSVADLEKQEKLGKEKTSVEALKPLLSQVRTLSEKLRQKPMNESELAELEAKRTKKIHEQVTIDGTLAQLAFNEAEYLACESETASVQKVQLRFIDLWQEDRAGHHGKEAGSASSPAGSPAKEHRTHQPLKGDRGSSIQPG